MINRSIKINAKKNFLIANNKIIKQTLRHRHFNVKIFEINYAFFAIKKSIYSSILRALISMTLILIVRLLGLSGYRVNPSTDYSVSGVLIDHENEASKWVKRSYFGATSG